MLYPPCVPLSAAQTIAAGGFLGDILACWYPPCHLKTNSLVLGMESQLLAPQELKIMQILWNLKKGFVKDILDNWPDEPKPAYNTVSTIVRILDKKGFVGHEAFGRSHRYFPQVSKSQYQFRALRNMVDQVFSGSSKGLVARLLEDDQLSRDEVEELKHMLND